MNMTVNNNGGINFQAALASGDIQTIIQMVQSERVRLLDSQLVDQVKTVQARNDQIAKLNNVLSELNAAAARFDGKSDPTSKLNSTKDWGKSEQHVTNGTTVNQGTNVRDKVGMALGEAGLDSKTILNATFQANKGGGTGSIGDVTKGDIDAAITKIKGMIDAESNNQQMDMLRLQSLNNKKNESIEILTNTQKKHTDAASNIIRNL
ncbi:hypothetical protein ACFO0J_06940 [Castellaniella hirudinis]|uniref:Secreted protein n=1 Tax=Castellaniella hirudinis TaxID=1144617 RepID=A0ABV8RWY0_9BURK